MKRSSPVHLLVLVVGTALAANTLAGDCFNDEPPPGTDLEPPIPGHDADLLRITDEDIERMREAMQAHELSRGAGDAPPQPSR